jgi:hypothetical protein
LLNLSRNLSLITGTSVIGAMFAYGSGVSDVSAASAEDIASGMRPTFAVAAVLMMLALAVAVGSLVPSRQTTVPDRQRAGREVAAP